MNQVHDIQIQTNSSTVKTIRCSVDKWCQLIKEGIEIPMITYLDGASMEPLIRCMQDPVTIVPVNRELIPLDTLS